MLEEIISQGDALSSGCMHPDSTLRLAGNTHLAPTAYPSDATEDLGLRACGAGPIITPGVDEDGDLTVQRKREQHELTVYSASTSIVRNVGLQVSDSTKRISYSLNMVLAWLQED